MNVTVTDATDRRRYEVQVDGELAGYADYQVTPDAMVLPHVEVLPRLEGRGLGGTLARAALDDARRRGLQVLPLCPFVRDWIVRHPDYADLVQERTTS
ncbi:GNAT family N-acetyltransferase [Actinomadura sp. HBU206391]|uniref:GNAT family N-acetyltransferase n=1 Tax=Actinomadura sp. HBU206391 TaxID=2731692 RepID=UPI001650BF74|nr:GNAT family N-acetyltransferase [Actinomadura sp. HBU206391]MBC6461755.1 N-acetyltransferase [Actinomadura sp. HBU206391]